MQKSNSRKGNILAPETTHLKSVLSLEAVLQNLDSLKLKDYPMFLKVMKVGKQITKATQNQSLQQLKAIIENNFVLIALLKPYIDDGFLQALHFGSQDIVEYYLKNGYELATSCPQALTTVSLSLQYLKSDPPFKLLETLLQHNAQINYCEQQHSMTAIHLAAKYGCLEAVKILVEYGCDYDAVDDSKKTPLNYAVEGKHREVEKYLREIGAKDDWRY